MEVAFGWLKAALEYSGVGAKTASGYGRFSQDDQQTDVLLHRLEEEERKEREKREVEEAMSSPEGRWRIKLKGLTETQLLEEVRVNLEKQPIRDGRERRAFADAVWTTGFPEYWRKGKIKTHTNVGVKKLKQRARLVREVLSEAQR